MKEVVRTTDAPQAIGPYSQAIKANGMIFASGQISLDPLTQQIVDGDIVAQTGRVLMNLEGVLKAAGSDLSKVIKTTVFLKDINDFAKMNETYGRFFKENPPARSTVEVSCLPKNLLVEIDVIALM
jgi:2-iminobutanoate/2-iminopropanoate deaminase